MVFILRNKFSIFTLLNFGEEFEFATIRFVVESLSATRQQYKMSNIRTAEAEFLE